MCLEPAENPMMYVPWWVNIGWFHAMHRASSGLWCATQSTTSTIPVRLSIQGMVFRNSVSVYCHTQPLYE